MYEALVKLTKCIVIRLEIIRLMSKNILMDNLPMTLASKHETLNQC